MNALLHRELQALDRMTYEELREKYRLVFGAECRTPNRIYLIKRIAWQLQAHEEGGLSERARHRAEELADGADLRVRMPSSMPEPKAKDTATRTEIRDFFQKKGVKMPMPGTVLVRRYRGQSIRVTVLAKGFEFEGQVHRSLSAIAGAVTGSHWNGKLFFGLYRKGVAS